MDITSYLLGKKAGGGSATLQTKQVEVTSNGSQNITADSGYDGLSKVELTTNVQPDLESKSITITENTTTTISPTTGKDGLSSVSVTTNVPQGITPTGTINITENGTVDVTNYASADVNVSGSGADLSDYFKTNIDNNSTGSNRFWRQLLKKTPPIHVENFVTSLQYAFSGIYISQFDFSEFDASNITDMQAMFYFTYSNSYLDLSKINASKVTIFFQMFQGSTFTGIDLSGITLTTNANLNDMFSNAKSLTYIDMRNFDFSNVTQYSNMFGSSSSDGIPNDCLIIVKNDTQKNWITSKFSRLTNVQTVAEYEAN